MKAGHLGNDLDFARASRVGNKWQLVGPNLGLFFGCKEIINTYKNLFLNLRIFLEFFSEEMGNY